MSTRPEPWGSNAVEIATGNGIIPGNATFLLLEKQKKVSHKKQKCPKKSGCSFKKGQLKTGVEMYLP